LFLDKRLAPNWPAKYKRAAMASADNNGPLSSIWRTQQTNKPFRFGEGLPGLRPKNVCFFMSGESVFQFDREAFPIFDNPRKAALRCGARANTAS
jgi:hypothetical protein